MFGRDRQKPVYVINGFLDSGKTSFFAYTLGQPYFQTAGKTLVVLCEEGEVEYGKGLLDQSNTVVEVIDDLADFTPSRLMSFETRHNPVRILIEWNGMWNFQSFKLPRKWRLEQQITTIDASTFSMYFTNMRSLLAEQLRNSELIMLNRCDGIDEKTLMSYKRNIKAINQKADLIFEDEEGEIDMTTEEDLPFDINAKPIDLEGINYGIWYLDAMEHPDRYVGREVRYTGMAMVPPDLGEGYFIPGRMAMTCCANDMQFLGYACRYQGAGALKERSWVRVTATITKENFHAYQGEPAKEPAEPIINFSA